MPVSRFSMDAKRRSVVGPRWVRINPRITESLGVPDTLAAVPRVAIAVPTFEGGPHVRPALESLLAQTCGDLRIVAVDDGSRDGTADTLRALATSDGRLEVHVNPRRLGMLQNTNRALALARAHGTELIALGSDHDRWDPGWLAALTGALDAHPRAVLAYPLTERIDGRGDSVADCPRPWRCATLGESSPWRRVKRAYRCMVAGDMIYGVARAAALDAVGGGYQALLVPDRLLLAQLALLGEFVQVEQVLWQRRFVGLADLDRQRRAFWPDGGAPGVTRLPWWVAHAAVAATVSPGGPRLAMVLAREGARLRLLRRAQRLRRGAGARLEAPTRALLRRSPSARAAVRDRRLPLPDDTQDVLARLLREAENGSAARPGRPGRPLS
jgi:hypothetical protein